MMQQVSPDTEDRAGKPALVCSGVSKAFGGRQVLDQLNLTVSHGERLSILGESGCGKTTLLRIIAGLEVADAGNVETAIGSPNDQGGGPAVNMIFQRPAVYPHMTVRENLAFPLRARRRSKSLIEERVDAIVSLLGLGSVVNQRAGNLSGGEAQRVALGRAIAEPPKLLLLDEPFSNLHQNLRWQLIDDVRRLSRTIGLASVFVTHDGADALYFADTVAVLSGGQIIQSAAPSIVSSTPATLAVARLLFRPTVNILSGAADATDTPRGGARLLLAGGTQVQSPVTLSPGPISVAWRSEDAVLSAETRENASNGLNLQCIVVDCGHYGDGWLTTVSSGNLVFRVYGAGVPLEVGLEAWMFVPFAALHLFGVDSKRIIATASGSPFASRPS